MATGPIVHEGTLVGHALRDRPGFGRVVTSAVLLGVVSMVLAGCRAPDTTSDGLELACGEPQRESLGVPTIEVPARFTTSGGRLRFVVTSLPPGTILGDVDDTQVQLGDVDSPSDDIRYRVTTSPQEPGVIDVDAGTYRVVNTARGRLLVEACPEVTFSDVEASERDPRGVSSTGSTSTPSGEPASPPSDEGTPGTSVSDS